jgi:transposase InsO family protein
LASEPLAGSSPDAQALQRALAGGHCPLIHHSDQGLQYACQDYIDLLKETHVQISMATVGKPEDNGYAERLMRTIKEEEVDLSEYTSWMTPGSPPRGLVGGVVRLLSPESLYDESPPPSLKSLRPSLSESELPPSESELLPLESESESLPSAKATAPIKAVSPHFFHAIAVPPMRVVTYTTHHLAYAAIYAA